MKNAFEHFINFLKNFIHIKLRHKPIYDTSKVFQEWYHPAVPTKMSDEPIITWVGQATFLIQIAGINILTDPIFYPLSLLFPRIMPPGIAIENLPPIDIILLSHDHRDHMEKQSLIYLTRHNPVVLVPKGLEKRLAKWGFKKVVEHTHGQSYTVTTDTKQQTKFTFLPAAHWSGSNLFNLNQSEHGSWMVEEVTQETNKTPLGHTIYFAGDTSYNNHFKEIAKTFPLIDTALLPIGPIEPRHLVEHAHLDGKQAVNAFIDLSARQFIPMHWGTFQFGTESFEDPINLVKHWWEKQEEKLKDKRLRIVRFGKPENLLLFFFARFFIY